jgi:hypothetical protein
MKSIATVEIWHGETKIAFLDMAARNPCRPHRLRAKLAYWSIQRLLRLTILYRWPAKPVAMKTRRHQKDRYVT